MINTSDSLKQHIDYLPHRLCGISTAALLNCLFTMSSQHNKLICLTPKAIKIYKARPSIKPQNVCIFQFMKFAVIKYSLSFEGTVFLDDFLSS